jgi:hypothetical protein
MSTPRRIRPGVVLDLDPAAARWPMRDLDQADPDTFLAFFTKASSRITNPEVERGL